MAIINQSNQNNIDTGSTTCSVTLPSSVAAGSVLVCFTTGSTGTVSMGDDKGNSYQTGTANHSYYALNAAAGTTTVTVTSSVSESYLELIVIEVNQANAGGGFDKPATASGSGTSASVSITTAVANEIILGYLDSGSGTSLAVGSGYTLIQNAIDLAEYKIQATATATTATATQGTGSWSIYAVAFKPLVATSAHFLGLLGCGR